MSWISVLIAFSVAVVAYLHPMDPEQAKEVAKLVSTLSVTLLGFVVTALSILTAVPDKELMVKMKEHNHYRELTHNFFICALALLLTLLLSVSGVMISLNTVSIATLASFAWAMATFSLAGWKFYQVMKYI